MIIDRIKFLALLGLIVMMASGLQAQESTSTKFKEYKALKKSAAPYSDEGRKARNQDDLDLFRSELSEEGLSDYEFHILQYLNSSRKIEDGWHLNTAREIRPDESLVIGEAIEYYGMTSNVASLKETTAKALEMDLYRKDHQYYDMMNAIGETIDVLFTNGETDTRPLLMDVSLSARNTEIIRISWLEDEGYLAILASKGYTLPSYTSPSQFIRDFHTMNGTKEVRISPTINHETLKNIGQGLYPAGLLFSLDSDDSEGNLEFFRTKALTESLDQISNAQLKMNYLPLLLDVWRSTEAETSTKEKKALHELIEDILKENNLESLKSKLLD